MDPSEPVASSTSGRQAEQPPDLRMSVRLWGTRGSIPSPGPLTARYGGNTSCVEVRFGRTRIALDAGTGIRLLGEALIREGGVTELDVLLTHFHWDHIQGIPFFPPVYDPAFRVRVFGPPQDGQGVEDLLAGQMAPGYFPISLGELPCTVECLPVEEGEWMHGEIRVRAMEVRHPSRALGYRLEAGGRSVVYIPDNELEGGSYPEPEGWGERIAAFVGGADLLLHDAMFTAEEAPDFRGWGHSTYEQALELALRAGVRQVHFFHHAPSRTDEELDALLPRYREVVERRGGDLVVGLAMEGMELELGA